MPWQWHSPLVAVLLLAGFTVVHSQLNCAQAPSPAARIVCEQLHRWDTNARSAPPVTTKLALPPSIPGMPQIAAELAPVAATPYQCMDLGCLCSYMGGNGQQGSNACSLPNGRPLNKALRKEYRMLTDDERDRYHAAVKQIKQSGEYDRLAAIHSQFATAGGAHSGPAFLPWHREYIKRYEIALRQIDPSLALPYWDSTLDGNLPNPRDSSIWTDEFMGNTDAQGNLVTGDFAGFRTLSGRANVLRRVGAQGTLFQEREIQNLLQQTQIDQVLAFTAPRQGCTAQTSFNAIEYTHGNVHIFVGGDMLDQSTSAADPVFFMHHSFVDLVWELWRENRQNRFDRENAYPLDMQLCSSANHFGAALMRPFEPWRNTDGLSNKYTDNMYSYAPRPTCAMGPNCGSKYLFCDRSHGAPRCAAKIRVGGSCAGFVGGEDMCDNGQCVGGRCVAGRPKPPRPKPPPRPAPRPAVETCFNEHECCGSWAQKGECRRNGQYMNAWCKASCGVCRPTHYQLAVECNDRHPKCAAWARTGECNNNPYWMTENCRKACGKCQVSRAQVCGGGQQQPSRPTPPKVEKCDSPGCFNENVCCQIWGLQGQCSKRGRAAWMSCNCRVSCGLCIPTDYMYGVCGDYHRDCPAWARLGECSKNPWTLENCRFSCGTCLSAFELQQLCRTGAQPRPRPRGRRSNGHSDFWDIDEDVLTRWTRDANMTEATGMPAPITPDTM